MKKNRKGSRVSSVYSNLYLAAFILAAVSATNLLVKEINLAQYPDYESLLSRVLMSASRESHNPDLPPQSKADFSKEHILVKFKDGISKSKKDDVLLKNKLKEKEEIRGIGVKVVKIDVSEDPQSVVERIKRNHKSEIEFAELDVSMEPSLIPNDPRYSSQWHLVNTEAPSAWDTTTCSNDVIIAVLDSGIDTTHTDLSGKIVSGWNAYENSSNYSDLVGHGTAVAGTAAASSNNATGISSYGWNCKIMPIRISHTDTGYAYYSTAAKALTYAADKGARIANLSYKFTGSSAVTSAAQYFQNKSNGVVTVSAGNDGDFITTADNPYILTISATASSNTLASWSTRGNQIDISAPGQSIPTLQKNNSYATWSGTSFSAPIVAGVAALMVSANPNLTSDQIQAILKSSADDLGTLGWDPLYGHGKVNAKRAVEMAKSYVVSAPAPSPTPTISPTPTVSTSPSPTISTSPSPSVSPTFQITKVSANNKTSSELTINWTTNLSSTGYVQYGTSESALTSVATDPNSGTSHSVIIKGLSTNTRYFYRVKTTSSTGLSITSPLYNARTSRR